jgi:hypothetical protein
MSSVKTSCFKHVTKEAMFAKMPFEKKSFNQKSLKQPWFENKSFKNISVKQPSSENKSFLKNIIPRNLV